MNKVQGILLGFTMTMVASLGNAAEPTTSIDTLAWMEGSWAGPTGPSRLEETWSAPAGGTMIAAVRMTTGEETSMAELIIINEEDNGLTLRLQQYSRKHEPRFPAQPLRMTEQSSNSVTFEATGPGGLKKITYSRPKDDEFNIHVLLTEGQEFVAPLRAVR